MARTIIDIDIDIDIDEETPRGRSARCEQAPSRTVRADRP
ncbi:hypothetical protein J2S43_000748 [Catenuloplanes nepalensis]|uniref:Uncharacterized protein n=1 Tax=Catenuloplanes nepalensis TaxID=587533 RepID=A0ABT9MLE1_9ACTN|nr:hypothetical protein [Catenuloplanes nepalensis]